MAQQTLIAWKSLNAEVLPIGNVHWSIMNNRPVVVIPNSGDYPYFYLDGSIPKIYNSGYTNIGFFVGVTTAGAYNFNFQFEKLFSGTGTLDMRTSNFGPMNTLSFSVGTANSISKQNLGFTSAQFLNMYKDDLFRIKIMGSGNAGNAYFLGMYLSEDPESSMDSGFDGGFS